MGKNKIGLEVKGFDELIERLEVSGGNVRETVEDCLKVAHSTVTPKLHSDMKKHHRTGRTEEAIIDKSKIEWQGMTATVEVGFDLKNGGMASVYLMYGTPRIPKDTKLYNDVYGSKIKKEIAEKQEVIFQKAMSKLIGG